MIKAMITFNTLLVVLASLVSAQSVSTNLLAQRSLNKEPTQLKRKIRKDCRHLGFSRHLLAPPRRKPLPEYPVEAKQKGVSGKVEVVVYVGEEGKVYSAAVCKGPILLRQAALDAAYEAEFEGVKYEGKSVKTKTLLTYEFSTH